MAAPAIQLDHVTFQYDSQAEPTLHDINLTIQPGEKSTDCWPVWIRQVNVR
ncbi:ABC transporter ATP-binding protein [Lacticaseibacillus paracasei subsp. paracasei Lpp227]|nr:ABC transporter ATP-binding protein [Lacticaseibacillus paracasei subsp. paracasei Lpp227]